MKTCFVIQGVGKRTEDTDGRVLDLDASYEVIKEAVESAGLECVRADEVIHSGTIDVPMYERLLNADLVIADLSTNNVGAAFELGVRHALRPYSTIVLAEEKFKNPFDLGHIVIRSYQHLGEAIGFRESKRLIAELKTAINAIMSDPVIDSPVYTYIPNLRQPVLQKQAAGQDSVMSAFVPGYQHDIFVSYAHVDDLTVPGVEAGWVATLISGLKVNLSQKLGRSDLLSISIWNDELLSPNKPLTPQILVALKQSATVVIILSPGYTASSWCQREMEPFWQELAQRVNSDSRIFVVERDKLEIDEKPKALEELLGYQFWLQDREGKAPRILGFPKPDLHDRLYYDKLSDFAYDLANELNRLKNQVTRPKVSTPRPPENAPIVFLCYASEDRNQVEQLSQQLQAAGIETWQDKQNLRAGDNWDRQLVHVIQNLVDYVIVVQTPAMISQREGYFYKEIATALDWQKYFAEGFRFILPIIYSDQKILEQLKDFHSIRLDAKDGFLQLVDTIKTDWQQRQKQAAWAHPKDDIFLSYAREDLAKAKQLAAALEKQGWSVSWDRTALMPGQDIEGTIRQAIEQTGCMIVAWSATSKKSDWVRYEATIGLERKILVPILFDLVDPPIAFRALRTENFANWNGDLNSDEFVKLQHAVARLVGLPDNDFDRMQSGAVFLSYASEDRPTVMLIRDALEEAGIDVWFERNPEALRVEENFESKIKNNIDQCSLFVPIISRNTLTPNPRYFRREWHYAQQRARQFPDSKRFIIPVAIDDTPANSTAVPEQIRKLHWGRMPGGQAGAEFVDEIKGLYREYKRTLAQ